MVSTFRPLLIACLRYTTTFRILAGNNTFVRCASNGTIFVEGAKISRQASSPLTPHLLFFHLSVQIRPSWRSSFTFEILSAKGRKDWIKENLEFDQRMDRGKEVWGNRGRFKKISKISCGIRRRSYRIGRLSSSDRESVLLWSFDESSELRVLWSLILFVLGQHLKFIVSLYSRAVFKIMTN